MKYQWVLFDADHTLFDFDSFTGLNTVLAQYGISLTRAEYDDFQRINQPLWTAYQNGKIGIAELSEIRFAKLAARAGMDTCWFNPHAAPNTGSIIPTYEIRRLDEVCTIAFPKQAA